MPSKKKSSKFSILEALGEHIDNGGASLWEGTLEDYVKMVIENPSIHMEHTKGSSG